MLVETRKMYPESTYGKNGIQKIFRFDNGYGASIVKHRFSYGNEDGLFELAVIRFEDSGEWELDYGTPITEDVIGYLSENDVSDILDRIKELPKIGV